MKFHGISAFALMTGLTALPAAAQVNIYATDTRYDLAGRIVGKIGPDADGVSPFQYPAARNTYDTRGNLVRVEMGSLSSWQAETLAPASWGNFNVLQTTEFLYDRFGRKTQEQTISGGVKQVVAQYSYDVFGHPECTAVRMNPNTFNSLPASACTLATAGADGPDRVTKTNYDTLERVISIQRAYGTPLQQTYAAYTYRVVDTKNVDQKETEADAKGNVTRYVYDGHGRLKEWRFPSPTSVGQSSTTDYEAYGYDARGLRTSLRKRDGQTIIYGYDALGRQGSIDYPGTTPDVSVVFDNLGRITSATAAGIQTIDNVWDNANRMTSATAGGRTLSYLYDANGNRTRTTWPDGFYVTQDHDNANRPTFLKESGSTQRAAFTYDLLGRRQNLNYPNSTSVSYGFDAAGRLSSQNHSRPGTAVTYTLGYNAASQQIANTISNSTFHPAYVPATSSYAANGLNQYTSINGAAVSHDANGNMTAAGSWTYGYDATNRLISANGTGMAATYGYDVTGRRIRKTVNGTVTTYLYDGPNLVAEYDSSGVLLRRYVFGPGTDEPLLHYSGSSVKYVYRNWQGSVIALADSNGAVPPADIYTYGPFGESNNPASGSLFRYTGQVYDAETGLYHYKARTYSPIIGRFLQTDPVGYKDNMNLYGYVGNDPLNKTDPTGMTCILLKDGGVECKVDENKGMTKGQITRINNAYTRIVKKLLSNPDKKTTIKVNDNSFTVTAKEQAKILSDAIVTADATPSGNKRADVIGGPQAWDSGAARIGDPAKITLYPGALQSDRDGNKTHIDRDIGRTLLHESFHANKAEGAMFPQYHYNRKKFDIDHTVPYNNSSVELDTE